MPLLYSNPHALISIPSLLQYHFLVFILALTAVLGNVISLEAPSLVFWRVSIAGLAMLAWLTVTCPAMLRLSPRRALAVFNVGLLQGAHWVCFFLSVSLSSVSVALAAFATISLFTSISEPLIERRAFRLGELLCGGIVISGILLITGGIDPIHKFGLLVGLAGALLHAIFPVLNRDLAAKGTPPKSMLLYGMGGACLMSAIILPFLSPYHLQAPSRSDWIPLLTLSILCTTIAHTWNIRLLRRLTAYTANLTMNFEPVWGILLGAVIFQEYTELKTSFYLGAILIILANFIDPWLKKARACKL